MEYIECIERLDLGPLFKGLPGDKNSCPQWGYMLKGAHHIQYTDGTEEVIAAGDICYLPAGHGGWFEAGSAMIIVSPQAEHKMVTDQIARNLQG